MSSYAKMTIVKRILALSLVLTLAACGSSTPITPPPPPVMPQTEVTVTITPDTGVSLPIDTNPQTFKNARTVRDTAYDATVFVANPNVNRQFAPAIKGVLTASGVFAANCQFVVLSYPADQKFLTCIDGTIDVRIISEQRCEVKGSLRLKDYAATLKFEGIFNNCPPKQ
jgi:predicted small lipoprotein YifL